MIEYFLKILEKTTLAFYNDLKQRLEQTKQERDTYIEEAKYNRQTDTIISRILERAKKKSNDADIIVYQILPKELDTHYKDIEEDFYLIDKLYNKQIKQHLLNVYTNIMISIEEEIGYTMYNIIDFYFNKSNERFNSTVNKNELKWYTQLVKYYEKYMCILNLRLNFPKENIPLKLDYYNGAKEVIEMLSRKNTFGSTRRRSRSRGRGRRSRGRRSPGRSTRHSRRSNRKFGSSSLTDDQKNKIANFLLDPSLGSSEGITVNDIDNFMNSLTDDRTKGEYNTHVETAKQYIKILELINKCTEGNARQTVTDIKDVMKDKTTEDVRDIVSMYIGNNNKIKKILETINDIIKEEKQRKSFVSGVINRKQSAAIKLIGAGLDFVMMTPQERERQIKEQKEQLREKKEKNIQEDNVGSFVQAIHVNYNIPENEIKDLMRRYYIGDITITAEIMEKRPSLPFLKSFAGVN